MNYDPSPVHMSEQGYEIPMQVTQECFPLYSESICSFVRLSFVMMPRPLLYIPEPPGRQVRCSALYSE